MQRKNHNCSTKKNGVVYTPKQLAIFVAEKVISYYLKDNNADISCFNTLKNLRIIDPACGEGELLTAIWETLNKYSRSITRDTALNPNKILCGIDIDRKAINKTKKRLSMLTSSQTKGTVPNFLVKNSLLPSTKTSTTLDWKKINKKFRASSGYDILIANPPWGAHKESYKKFQQKNFFTLNKGQFDTADLFVELATSIVKPGGFFAFILPDSLFNAGRTDLRKMLLSKTEIKYIGRFGEKIFNGINRACAVIVCKNKVIKPANSVECFRLTPDLRRRILNNEASFQEADKLLTHKVRQSRFVKNKDFLFDIDIKDNETSTIKIVRSSQNTLSNFVSSSRGIELSKSGKTLKCTSCNLWMPFPKTSRTTCPHCGSAISPKDSLAVAIISSKQQKGYKPLLVGEHIKRYNIASQLWIATNKNGINYKEMSLYKDPKILIRKTGLGISASIDFSGALTNQVVYILKPRSSIEHTFPQELFLSIINSRAIFYYLAKKFGETEWRSHPYLTQKQILDLPLPNLTKQDTSTSYKINKLVNLVSPYLKTNKGLPNDIDAKVENIISQLYCLSKNNYRFIYKALDEAEQLLPIKALKNIGINDIFNN
ncbi:MAG: N-6 DNA methylase [Candidatus Saganbacteria bacterium]|nr:N-6 DNA methylase [Candidatus Saganbacteria bacterium]